MKSFKKLLFLQYFALIFGMILFVLFSNFFSSKLSYEYEKKYVEQISSVLAENLKLITEIYPNKYLIEESMRRAVKDIPSLDGLCLSLGFKKYCYPRKLKVKYTCSDRRKVFFTETEVIVCLPIYEEYASEFLEKEREGHFLAVFNRGYVDQIRNYWFLDSLFISLFFIIIASVVIISIWIDINADFNKLKSFIEELKDPDRILAPLEEKLGEFKIEEFRDVADLIVKLTLKISSLNEHIKQLALTDSLTGLYNRNYLNAVFEKNYVPFWKREKFPLSVALLDIDNFKSINDIYGHQKGDEVLRRLGQIIKDSVRGSDIPVRFGGEEILIIFPSSRKEEALMAVKRIRERLMKEDFGIGRPVTFSSGLADFPSDISVPGGLDKLIKIADERLYKAKNQGKNRDILE